MLEPGNDRDAEAAVVIVFDVEGRARAFRDLDVADAAMEITDRLDDSNVESIYVSDGHLVRPETVAGWLKLQVADDIDMAGLEDRLRRHAQLAGWEAINASERITKLIEAERRGPRLPKWFKRSGPS